MPRILEGDFFCVWNIPEALIKGLNDIINGDLCLSPMITKTPINKNKKNKKRMGKCQNEINLTLSWESEALNADGLVEIPYIFDLPSI